MDLIKVILTLEISIETQEYIVNMQSLGNNNCAFSIC